MKTRWVFRCRWCWTIRQCQQRFFWCFVTIWHDFLCHWQAPKSKEASVKKQNKKKVLGESQTQVRKGKWKIKMFDQARPRVHAMAWPWFGCDIFNMLTSTFTVLLLIDFFYFALFSRISSLTASWRSEPYILDSFSHKKNICGKLGRHRAVTSKWRELVGVDNEICTLSWQPLRLSLDRLSDLSPWSGAACSWVEETLWSKLGLGEFRVFRSVGLATPTELLKVLCTKQGHGHCATRLLVQ